MKKKKSINRRKFIGDVTTTAATFSIVPRHVLGKGMTPPSDKIRVANIGCGTQGLREMPDMLQNDAIQVVAVCDVNKYTTDYLDWSPNGILNGIRNTLGNKHWGRYIKGIPGGRDIGKSYVDDYYASKSSSTKHGCTSYEDYRELFEKEKDLDAVKIMTPDHHHGCIAMAAMSKGLHVITHKPISNRLHEGLKVIEATKTYDVRSHLMAWEDKPNYRLIKKWMEDGVIGQLTEIHNWSVRPVWPQFTAIPTEQPPIPDGFNWQLWLGPEKDRPYHPNYTHNVFRGWYDFGGGSIADMGHYSLFPLFRTFNINNPAVSARAYGSTTRTSVNGVCRNVNNTAAFPGSCMIKFQFEDQGSIGPFDLYWYDGGMKPFAPEELEVDGRDVSVEGMLFVGTEGKILAGFEGENPEIIPKSRMAAYSGTKSVDNPSPERRSDTWSRAILSGEESPGSFRYASPVHETLNLGAVALRARKFITYDHTTKSITNDADANKLLNRDYRPGWEII